MARVDYAPPVKRSVVIAGHATSISLEPVFWRSLETSARESGCPVNALVAKIDVARLEAKPTPNLTSAIRQWLFANALGDETWPSSTTRSSGAATSSVRASS